MLTLHGTADKSVDVKQSQQFAAALKKVGAVHELVIVEGAPHTFHLQPKERDLRPVVLGFFDTHLRGDTKDGKKTGTVIGVLLERTPGKGVLVKADGEETPRRYWRFGDRKDLFKQIDSVPIGSRVELTWEVPHANEGPHIAKIVILKSAASTGEPLPPVHRRAGSPMSAARIGFDGWRSRRTANCSRSRATTACRAR